MFWRHHIGPTAGLLQGKGNKKGLGSLHTSWAQDILGGGYSFPCTWSRWWTEISLLARRYPRPAELSPASAGRGLVNACHFSPLLCTCPELYFLLQPPQHRSVSCAIETGKIKQMPIIPFHPYFFCHHHWTWLTNDFLEFQVEWASIDFPSFWVKPGGIISCVSVSS